MAGDQPKQDVGGGSNQLAGLKARIDSMQQSLAEMQAARTSGLRVRLGILIIMLVVILGYTYHMYQYFKNYKVEDLMSQMQLQVLNTKSDVAGEAMQLAREVLPVYKEAFQAEFKQSMPEIQKAAQDELKRLMDVVPKAAESSINTRLTAIAKKQEQKLVAAFPELKDDKMRDIVMANLEEALRNATLNVFEAKMKQAEDQLLDIQEKVLKMLPEKERGPYVNRMDLLWNQLLLYELQGKKQLQEP